MVLLFGCRKTTRTFFPTSKPLNILDDALFVNYFVLHTLFLLFCGILTCNCISFAYLAAVYTVNTPSTRYSLFLTVENVPLTFHLVLWLWKNKSHLFPTSKPLNILDGAFFVVYFLLNTLFLLFCCILTCTCISCACLVAVFTVNTKSTAYCLFLTAENVPLTFGFVLWLWENHAHLFSNFETSKYLRLPLVCCLFRSKYVVSALFRHFNL